MKSAFIKAYTSLLFFFGSVAIILGCAGDMWEVEDELTFTPEVVTEYSYWPFIFSELSYNGYYTYIPDSPGAVDEWADFLKGALTRDDIHCLLNTEDFSDIQRIKYAVEKGKKFYNGYPITDTKVKQFVEFLWLAKQNEQTLGEYNYWDYENITFTKSPKIAGFYPKLIQAYNQEKNPFLKSRYWFQLVKHHFYESKPEVFTQFFENTEKQFAHNRLYYDAVRHYAGKITDPFKRCLLAAEMFHYSPQFRLRAAVMFNPIDQSTFEDVLKKATTSQQKEAIWAMYGFFVDEVEAIKQLYSLNPKSEHLDFLLGRIVNKLEYFEVNPYLDPENKDSRTTVKQVGEVLEGIVAKGKLLHPSYWRLGLAYLYSMDGNTSLSNAQFDQIDMKKESDLFKKQVKLLRYYNHMQGVSTFDAKEEAKYFEFTKEIPRVNYYDFRYQGQDYTPISGVYFRTSGFYRWLDLRIADLYRKQNEVEKAELFDYKDEFISNVEGVRKMKAFLKNSSNSPLIETMKSKYPHDLNRLSLFEGIMLVHMADFQGAKVAFSQTSFTNDTLEFDPFQSAMKDTIGYSYDNGTGTRKFCKTCTYTYKTFVDKLIRLETEIKQSRKPFYQHLLLAHGMYNISFKSNGASFHFPIPYDFNLIGNLDYSKKHYLKALSMTKDPERQARIWFQLAKIERNQYYMREVYSKSEENREAIDDFKAWEGFQQIFANYRHTSVYREALKECGYFRTYVDKLNQNRK